MINKTFSLITGKEVNIPVFTNPFFITNLAKITYIVPYKDMYVLNIYFPIEEILQSKYYSQKPFDYISNLIGHEGPGSILSFLKKNGWGQGISAGTFYEIDFSLFIVKIKLTATGIEHIYDVLNVFFDYIHLIKQKGINEWYFDELKEMSRIEYDYESKEEPYAATTNTASNMQLFAPEDVLTGNRLYITYYPDLINQVLDKINPYNMRVHCIASKFKELPNLETEQYYGTQFVEQLIDKNNLLSWNITRQQSSFGLYLPSKNPYIPQNLTVLSDPNPTALPEVIRSDELLGLYHKLDVSFGRPESAWEVLLSSPYIFDSAADYMLASLLVSTYRDSINDKLYYASIAGLDYSINTSPSGIRISISGFSQKQGDLIFEIVSGLFYFKATQDRFNTLKDELIRILQNFDLASPYQYSDFLSDIILQHPSYLPDDFLDILPVLNLDDMESYMDRIFSRIKLDIFAHGNIEKKDVLLITTRLITNVTENSNYHLNALLSTEVNLQRTIALPFGINYFYKIASPSPSEVSNAVKLYYQIGTSDTLASTIAEFFSYMISEPFFDKLRTKENLGYVVFAKYDPLSAVDGVSFIIQSPKTPDFVDVKISAWLENDWSSFLYDMSQYTFQNYQTSFANLLTEKPKSLSDKTSRYWKEIELRRFQWDRSEAQAEYVMTLSKRTIQLFTEKYFWRESPYMRKLSVYVYLNNATTNTLSMNDTKNKKLIRDLDAFKQRSNLFTALPWLQDNGGPAPTKNEVGMETYDLFPCEPEYKDPNEFFNTNTNNDFGSTIGYCSNRKHCVVCDNDDSSLCMRET